MENKKTISIAALIRIKALDDCLQDQSKQYTIKDLMIYCTKELKKYDVRKVAGNRSLEGDLKAMRNNSLGFKAPIIIKKNKYYSYSNPKFTITDYPIPISDANYKKLEQMISFIKIYQYFPNISELKERLE